MGVKRVRVVGVVPAKLTSQRLPRKNLAQIEGQALVTYSVRAALQAAAIDEVIVSSESEVLLATVKDLGARCVLRPASLSAAQVTNQMVLEHVLDWLEGDDGCRPQMLVLLQPTHPFRVPADIDAAVDQMASSRNFSSIFALRRDGRLFGRLDGDEFIPDVTLPRRRDLERPRYENTGSFYVLDVARTIRVGSFFGDRIGGQLLSRPDLEIDIDEPRDLEVARLIAREHRADLESLGLLDQSE